MSSTTTTSFLASTDGVTTFTNKSRHIVVSEFIQLEFGIEYGSYNKRSYLNNTPCMYPDCYKDSPHRIRDCMLPNYKEYIDTMPYDDCECQICKLYDCYIDNMIRIATTPDEFAEYSCTCNECTDMVFNNKFNGRKLCNDPDPSNHHDYYHPLTTIIGKSKSMQPVR